MNKIADFWQQYKALIIKGGCSEKMEIQIRNAFYAGAQCCFELIADCPEKEEQFNELIESICSEFENYASEILRNYETSQKH